MRLIKLLIIVLCLLTCTYAVAAVHYVGVGAQCNGSNHYDNLDLAILAAAVNGTEADEIRLTNTVTYTGALNGSYVLTGWNSGDNGSLTLSGGYANCNSVSSSGFTAIGDDADAVFEITGNSLVTLRNLQLFNSGNRALIVRGGSTVFLESVNVSGSVAGLRVLEGSFVSLDAGSSVYNNGDLDDIPKGGGIWCFGNNSQVNIAGTISKNQAVSGGNMFIEDGCFAELAGGARIKGDRADGFAYSAHSGGGIWVDDGGELYANGGQNRVQITDHRAIYDGGGIYVQGTGKATLLNTYIARNMTERDGAGLYAVDGGTSAYQVVMDRVASCPNLISCSEFEQNTFESSVVEIRNSKVKISRTLFERNEHFVGNEADHSIVVNTLGGILEMNHSGMVNNVSYYLIENYATAEIAHHTAAGNYTEEFTSGNQSDSFVWYNPLGSLRLENSIFQDTQGGDNGANFGTVTGQCNLIDNSIGWPGGAYVVGTATFNSVAGGDARQQSSSDGVDMCLEDTFAWSNDVDIEYQNAPVNENTNPQGNPGHANGLYDAGFDEVYDNIGEDEFLLTVQKEGSGTGVVISDPLGISCGSDCTEVVFNGTLVTLTATPTGNSNFIGWSGCPLVNGSNECLISVTESTTVYAEFQPDDLIFSDGFE